MAYILIAKKQKNNVLTKKYLDKLLSHLGLLKIAAHCDISFAFAFWKSLPWLQHGKLFETVNLLLNECGNMPLVLFVGRRGL